MYVLPAALFLAALHPAAFAGPDCDTTGSVFARMTYGTPAEIPNGNPAGITLGPLVVPSGGGAIEDVMLELVWAHTWVGDLVLDLSYDADCDGPADAIPARVLCRPRGMSAQARTPCGASSTTFGCSGDLAAGNVYRFGDDAAFPLGVTDAGTCTPTIAGGCYRPSDQGGSPLSVWNGWPDGGCWSLTIIDVAGADIGRVHEWAVHVWSERPIATTRGSWGSLKHTYR